MKFVLRIVGICAVIALIFFGFTAFRESRTTALARSDRPYLVQEAELSTAMADTLAANPKLELSIAITDLQTGKRYHYGDSLPYGSASIGKLVSAAAYLRLVELGQARLEDPVGNASGREQLERMIIKSDNAAWHAINELVTPAGLKAYAASIGVNSYEPNDNSVTADDISLLLEKLASYKLLNAAHTDLLLSLLEQANMRGYIVAAVPDTAQAYHKAGYLADRVHDAAIIRKGDRAYVLVIFSKSQGSYDFSKGATLFQTIARSTLKSFFGD